MNRKDWSEMDTNERRLHLVADHGLMPEAYGGPPGFEDVMTAGDEDLEHMHFTGHTDLEDSCGTPHRHLFPVHHLPQEGIARDELVVGTSGDAWEFAYETLRDWTTRGLCVELNGESGGYQLVEWVGDWDDQKGVILVKRWDEDQRDYVLPASIPTFLENGECAIRKVKVL